MKKLNKILLATLLLSFTFALSCSKDTKEEEQNDQNFASLENELLTLMNNYRATKSLPAFTSADVIVAEARKHSTNMANGTVAYGHDGDSQRLAEIAKTIPWSEGAENVGRGTGDAQLMLNTWIASPAHKGNIEYAYTKTGIGIAKSSEGLYYFTQIFIK